MREQYLSMRNSQNFDIRWLYNYFIDNGGKGININLFYQSVQMYGIDQICTGLDKKFNTMALSYKETGQIIRYF